ncbi:MAG: hypothetical protein ACW99G_23385 [Candidatus Thorarchaeota archaeon]
MIGVSRGYVRGTKELDGNQLYFIEADCEVWMSEYGCAVSSITLYLQENRTYDIVGWSEPDDRRTPYRELTVYE